MNYQRRFHPHLEQHKFNVLAIIRKYFYQNPTGFLIQAYNFINDKEIFPPRLLFGPTFVFVAREKVYLLMLCLQLNCDEIIIVLAASVLSMFKAHSPMYYANMLEPQALTCVTIIRKSTYSFTYLISHLL